MRHGSRSMRRCLRGSRVIPRALRCVRCHLPCLRDLQRGPVRLPSRSHAVRRSLCGSYLRPQPLRRLRARMRCGRRPVSSRLVRGWLRGSDPVRPGLRRRPNEPAPLWRLHPGLPGWRRVCGRHVSMPGRDVGLCWSLPQYLLRPEQLRRMRRYLRGLPDLLGGRVSVSRRRFALRWHMRRSGLRQSQLRPCGADCESCQDGRCVCGSGGAVSFASDVQPILTQHCAWFVNRMARQPRSRPALRALRT